MSQIKFILHLHKNFLILYLHIYKSILLVRFICISVHVYMAVNFSFCGHQYKMGPNKIYLSVLMSGVKLNIFITEWHSNFTTTLTHSILTSTRGWIRPPRTLSTAPSPGLLWSQPQYLYQLLKEFCIYKLEFQKDWASLIR